MRHPLLLLLAPIDGKTHQIVKRIRVGLLSALVCTLFLSVTACGKKPPNVDAPPNVDSSAFEQNYPDLSTDPSPTMEMQP